MTSRTLSSWRAFVYAIPLLLCFLATSLAGDEDPILSTEPKSYDFGDVLSGELLDRKIKLTNTGGTDLLVKKIEFTCGCTIPKVVLSTGEEMIPSPEKTESFVVLKPGEWADIRLVFQSIGRFGKVSHRMDIFTNDPEGQVRNIPIRANVQRAIDLDPARIDFGLLDKADKASRVIRVSTSVVGDFKITGIEDLPPYMDYTVEKDAEADAPCTLLTLNYKGGAPVGKHAFRAKVQLENEKVKHFALFVELRAFPSVIFKHKGERIYDYIDLGLLERGKAHTEEIEILNADISVPYRISQVMCKSNAKPHLKVRFEREGIDMRYKVYLEVGPGVKQRILRGSIILVSNHPDMPQAVIRFKGLYR